MTLVLIALVGVLGLAGVVGMLETGWRRAGRATRPGIVADDGGLAEDVELDVTAGLLAGRLSCAQYRATLEALAHGETARGRPHPHIG